MTQRFIHPPYMLPFFMTRTAYHRTEVGGGLAPQRRYGHGAVRPSAGRINAGWIGLRLRCVYQYFDERGRRVLLFRPWGEPIAHARHQ